MASSQSYHVANRYNVTKLRRVRSLKFEARRRGVPAHSLLLPSMTDMSPTESVTLVVLEQGSEWPEFAEHGSVLALVDDGEPQHLTHRIGALQRRQNVRVAVLACNETTGNDASSHRWLTARTLLETVAREGAGHLVVTAPTTSSAHFKQELLSIADSLRGVLAKTSASVSLRLVTPALIS